MNPIASTSAIQSKLSGANLVTKIQVYFSLLVQGIKKRFAAAAEAFHDTLEAEKRVAVLVAERTARVAPNMQKVQLGGFVISQASERVFPLYDGLNFFSVTKGGGLTVVPAARGKDAEYKIRVIDQEVLLECQEDFDRPQSLSSNETLTLGGEAFTLKLLPGEYRVDLSREEQS
ncbi:MAG: hypothetical protein H6617_11975 [Bdellovibrionaceae bacterium]|nr:hypothetical protein [Bdellovibrionales bacterium]MCB9255391.1 hypothetical protein [Pseudobdellovibrionaceae bacterium]